MFDLRSDTLSLPSEQMLETILHAKLGDSGRIDANGRGEDLTVNSLEDLAAKITGKDSSILFSSGTLANNAAILSYCKPGDKVLVDKIQHIYKSEKIVFDENFGQLTPVFYELNERNTPDVANIKYLIENNDIKLLCIENTHNFGGGSCISLEELKQIYELAKSHNIYVHMDGARVFNASAYLGVEVDEICKYTDSVMFCLSKGLGAPVGSLLCGNEEIISQVRVNKKSLGGNMRQAGIIAAPGIYALENNVEQLKKDNENARYVAKNLTGLKKARIQHDVQTNIIMMNIVGTGVTAEEYCNIARKKGLLIRPVLEDKVRLVFYNGISNKDTDSIIKIIKEIDESL